MASGTISGDIVDVRPRRGRGPGVVVLSTAMGLLEATTFDPVMLKLAVDHKGRLAQYVVQEKPSKDGSKTYTNLVSLVVADSTDPIPEEKPDTPSVHILKSQIEEAFGVDEPGPIGRLKPLVPSHTQEMARLETGYQVAKRRHELVLELLRSRMREGTHYVDGAMFGGKKPVLLQPGAHAIFQAVGFACVPSVLYGPLEAPEDPHQKYTIVVKTEVFDADGRLVGAQMGSCSSHIYSSRQMGYVPRAVDPDKTHNATLKMSVKRSTVAACRQTTPASELFAEDIDEGGYGEVGNEKYGVGSNEKAEDKSKSRGFKIRRRS